MLDVPPVAVSHGWPHQKGDKGVRFEKKENTRHAQTVVLDSNGRVTKSTGNGPILSCDSCADVSRLSKLRVILIDHNIAGPGSKTPRALCDDSHFTALAMRTCRA